VTASESTVVESISREARRVAVALSSGFTPLRDRQRLNTVMAAPPMAIKPAREPMMVEAISSEVFEAVFRRSSSGRGGGGGGGGEANTTLRRMPVESTNALSLTGLEVVAQHIL